MIPKKFEQQFEVHEFQKQGSQVREDWLAVEEPMEIRVVFGPEANRTMRNVSVTMRTPGHDEELATGFLFTEGFLTSPSDIDSIDFRGVADDGEFTGNIVRVNLRPDKEFDFSSLQRNFFTHSSCGVCGKTSLETLASQGISVVPAATQELKSKTIKSLPDLLRGSQPAFARTGGIHAAGLATFAGELLEVREDVGRHNAVDKLIGCFFQKQQLPARDLVLVVSGRASFEIVQKAVMAGVSVMVAVGAPSSLAVEMARRYQLTLIGFASQERFNVYAEGVVIRDE